MFFCREIVVRASALTTRTYFEICGLGKAQNRGSRPWLEPVPWQENILIPASGIKKRSLGLPSLLNYYTFRCELTLILFTALRKDT